MTLVADPEVLVDRPPAPEPDPDREHPAARWARHHAKPLVITGAAVFIVVIGLLVNELTKSAPVVPSAATPVVTIKVEGDVTGTTGTARFASGGQTDLPTGQSNVGGLEYTSTSPAGERVVAVSVAIVAGEKDASCTITVDGRVVVTKTVSQHSMALCFWAGDAGAPPPFRTDQ